MESIKQNIEQCLELTHTLSDEDIQTLQPLWNSANNTLQKVFRKKVDYLSCKSDGKPPAQPNDSTVNNCNNILRQNDTSDDDLCIFVPLGQGSQGHRYRTIRCKHKQIIQDFIQELNTSDRISIPNSIKDDKDLIQTVGLHTISTNLISELYKLSYTSSDTDALTSVGQQLEHSTIGTHQQISGCGDSNTTNIQIDGYSSKSNYSMDHITHSQIQNGHTESVSRRLSPQVNNKVSVFSLVPVKVRESSSAIENVKSPIKEFGKLSKEHLKEDFTPLLNNTIKDDTTTATCAATTINGLSHQNNVVFTEEFSTQKSDLNIQTPRSIDEENCDQTPDLADIDNQTVCESTAEKKDVTDDEKEINEDSVVMDTECYQTSSNCIDVSEGSLNLGVQSLEVKVEFPTDINEEIDENEVENQEVKDIGIDLHRSPSDIETIISALEEELKKTGASGVHSISISASGGYPQLDGQTLVLKAEEDGVQVVQALEFVNVDEDNKLWSTVDQSGALLSATDDDTLCDSIATLPICDESGNAISAVCSSEPIDANYDVVEYEVLAENGRTRKGAGGSRKRKREKGGGGDKDALDRTCPMCHRVLTYPSSMAAHMRTHTGDRPYSCGQCHRKFTTKANRDRHEATHVGLKPFKCSECEKCFTENRSLKIHMRCHTGERPFVCTVCNQAFAQKCTLKVHMDRHMDKKGHLCDLCGSAFRQKSQLDVHVKRHTRQANFPCSECSIKCYTKGDLARHMIKHTGERPYSCSICTKAFTRKQYLLDHENTHTGAKPYQCTYCTAVFHDMGSLHRHTRRHREQTEVSKGETTGNKTAVLSVEDYNSLIDGSETGKTLTLGDGKQVVVTGVTTETDGVKVYHVTSLTQQEKETASNLTPDTTS